MAEKYLIALEIDRVHISDTFETPPLHSTAMHWFSSQHPMEDVVELVSGVMSKEEPVLIIGGEPELFGLNKDVPVNTIRNLGPSVELHERLFASLTEIGAVHEAPYWTLDGYRAHVSSVGGKRLAPGEEYLATHAYMIVANPEDQRLQKAVVSRTELRGE